MSDAPLAPIIYLSHGGGPLPLFDDPGHLEMIQTLERIRAGLEKPKSIVMISAHWEAPKFRVSRHEAPPLIYDYGGFPDSMYEIDYAPKGQPQLADEIMTRLNASGLPVYADPDRGLDHGAFVPLKLLFPEADVPVVTVSLSSHFDPEQHIQLGKALKPLREQGVMIIGSGMSFHNLPMMFHGNPAKTAAAAQEFNGWLDDVVQSANLSDAERVQKLIHWEQAPNGRISHPREEHLLPLMVCYGAAGEPAQQVYDYDIMSVPSRTYVW